ncbi:hypothetical protein ACS8YF_18510 [Salinisphaera sp. SWV1]|uniref:hypothetical protein n=1 Tax=Salinisphaera sp. SWV1 TaxID=3454139 RepID=UPI003F843E40
MSENLTKPCTGCQNLRFAAVLPPVMAGVRQWESLMADDELIKTEILKEPTHYFAAQEKTLDARLESLELPPGEEKRIKSDRARKVIRDRALGLFKIGEVISEFLNWNEAVDNDLRDAKKEYLLSKYFEKNDENSEAISSLKDFLSSPQGNTIFNKILRILDDSPPDLELAEHLSSALQHVINNDFDTLFEQHKYALSQIERLTPQALTVLSDYRDWPSFTLSSYSAAGSKITSDWLSEFARAYSTRKNIADEGKRNRLRHSINELISLRFVEAHLVGEDKVASCRITSVGTSILVYVDA